MKNALEAAGRAWTEATGDVAVFSFAGSSALARQIQFGAPADVYISANPGWMDVLEREALIDPASRIDLVGNRLVLIAHGAAAPPSPIAPGFDLAGSLGDGKLAMALTEAVPAGAYGKAALTALGVWPDVAGQVVQLDNVRSALALVATGEALMGVVYQTDANASDAVTAVGVFPPDSHPPIVYPAATIRESAKPAKARFLKFLTGDAARRAFEREGFLILR